MRKMKRELTGLHRRGARAALAAGLLMLTMPLGGCSVSIADLPVIGLPEGAPARPKDPGTFPAVHDMPAPREQSALDPEEQARIESELAAARDRQAKAAGAPRPPGAAAKN